MNSSHAGINESELLRMARLASRLLAARPSLKPGSQPHKIRSGMGSEFSQFRHYTAGDDLRHIDWQLSARLRHPFVRQYRDEYSTDWFVCLDRSASMNWPDRYKWELAVQLTTAMTYILLHLGHRVGLLTFSSELDGVRPLGRGYLHHLSISQLLRTTQPRPTGGESQLQRCTNMLRPNTNVVLISDFLKPDAMLASLKTLVNSQRVTRLLQVLSETETDLVAPGLQVLVDAETHTALTIDGDIGGRAATNRLSELANDLSAFAKQKGIVCTSCKSSQQWQDVVLSHLKEQTHV